MENEIKAMNAGLDAVHKALEFDNEKLTLGHAEPVKLDERLMSANRLNQQAIILSDTVRRLRNTLMLNEDAKIITFPRGEVEALIDSLEFLITYSRDGALRLIDSVETRELFERENSDA